VRLPVLAAALAFLVLGGCGGDGEGAERAQTPPRATQPDRTETGEALPRTEPMQDRTLTSTSPEEQPGGAGDERAARTPALFTGRGGRIRPRVVRVPPFIAIHVELRSADGGAYQLRFGDRVVRDGQRADFAGLHAGRSLVGEGSSGSVRIVADAEPGP
jgi:hypothetical protein